MSTVVVSYPDGRFAVAQTRLPAAFSTLLPFTTARGYEYFSMFTSTSPNEKGAVHPYRYALESPNNSMNLSSYYYPILIYKTRDHQLVPCDESDVDVVKTHVMEVYQHYGLDPT